MKLDRLLGILTVLLQSDRITALELAEKFEVNRRTIGRDVDTLCQAGIPIVTQQGIGGGISIAEGYKFDKSILTSDELSRIIAALKGIGSVSERSNIERILDKLHANAGAVVSMREPVIIDLPEDDEDENPDLKLDTAGLGDLALHMKTLEIFFALKIPSLTDIQKALLKKTLEEMYADFGIVWETDIKNLSNKDFPIFSDLYELLVKKAADKEENRKESEINNFEILSCLIRDLAIGADSFIWNGHTNVEASSRITCLDTFDLQNTSDEVKRTQYLNI